MDFESFFSTPRWRILEILADRPSSPLEISKTLKTSVSYISQQLKLLEVAGLVKKEKTGTVDRGKPRSLYSLSKEIFYFTSLTRGWSGKKAMHLTDYHKLILRIWFLEDHSSHYHLERFYWFIEDLLSEIEGIYVRPHVGKTEVILVSPSRKVRSKIDNLSKEFKGVLEFNVFTLEEFAKKQFTGLGVIHDPSFIYSDKKEVKGGNLR